jgi:hypothetical protein
VCVSVFLCVCAFDCVSLSSCCVVVFLWSFSLHRKIGQCPYAFATYVAGGSSIYIASHTTSARVVVEQHPRLNTLVSLTLTFHLELPMSMLQMPPAIHLPLILLTVTVTRVRLCMCPGNDSKYPGDLFIWPASDVRGLTSVGALFAAVIGTATSLRQSASDSLFLALARGGCQTSSVCFV